MTLKQHLERMAGYHRWAYQELFDKIRVVRDEQYRLDVGLFFKSIHGTLNHLLLVERLWFGRFAGRPYAVSSLSQELVQEREPLLAALDEQAERWQGFVHATDEGLYDTRLAYTNTRGVAIRIPWYEAVIHVFNHGTHHRGQISAALTSLGYELAENDLYYYVRETVTGA